MSCCTVRLVIAMVADHYFRSGFSSKPNRCQTGGPGYQYTLIINSGTVEWQFTNPSQLGRLLVAHPVGPSLDSYEALVYAE